MRKRMVILTSYFRGESHGMLGPQMAATIIQENTGFDCIVIAVSREDDKALIKKAVAKYLGKDRPLIGFSTLSGREDLFSFAKELKEEGAVTILAGPQSDLDYRGETGWQENPYRFHGLSDFFSFSLHGPAEQIIGFLNDPNGKKWENTRGLLFNGKDGSMRHNGEKPWDEAYLKTVRWENLYRIGQEGLLPVDITTGQVLQQIGCPHASGRKWTDIDYPVSIEGREERKIRIQVRGCSFCDVAVDKGFYGGLHVNTVLRRARKRRPVSLARGRSFH